jgi:hypothetical protein
VVEREKGGGRREEGGGRRAVEVWSIKGQATSTLLAFKPRTNNTICSARIIVDNY